MTKVLLIEDDEETAEEITAELTDRGFEVEWSSNGIAGLEKARSLRPDAMIVDRLLPGMDGLSVIEALRKEQVRTPVLVLSALGAVDDRVRGLRMGGDDYLTKPFALAELLARLRNLLKRNSPAIGESTRLRVLDLELDLLRRVATRSGEALQLTPQEFVLLEYLCRNAGRVVTRSMILDKVWGMRIQPDTNVVDVHIYRLRGKVDGKGQQPLIRTLRGVGYVLKDR